MDLIEDKNKKEDSTSLDIHYSAEVFENTIKEKRLFRSYTVTVFNFFKLKNGLVWSTSMPS